jgi:hypothetical protein
MSAGEYTSRLNGLVGRPYQAEELMTRAEEKVALIEAIGADPVAWAMTSRPELELRGQPGSTQHVCPLMHRRRQGNIIGRRRHEQII